MANLKNVIYLSNEDYEILVSTGTVTIDGETLTYDENNVYITPDKLASSTEDGLMSSGDKVKLDSLPTFGTAASKDFTASVTSGSSDLVTSGAVYTAINNLPKPMLYKGTLGTNGTITDLPTASSSNEGFTYKVITAGTYASQSAEVGDVFISNGSAWTLVPSGDDVEDTWRQINVNGTQVLGTGISTGAVNFKNGNNVTITGSGNDITISATDTTYNEATTSTSGLMSASDKSKLDGLNDSNLVHKTGNETIGGNKSFEGSTWLQTTNIDIQNSGQEFAIWVDTTDTSNDTFLVVHEESSGYTSRWKTVPLTDERTYTFPDQSGDIIVGTWVPAHKDQRHMLTTIGQLITDRSKTYRYKTLGTSGTQFQLHEKITSKVSGEVTTTTYFYSLPDLEEDLDHAVLVVSDHLISTVSSLEDIPNKELGLYRFTEEVEGVTQSSHIYEVSKEDHSAEEVSFEKITDTNNTSLTTTTFMNQFASNLAGLFTPSSLTNVYALRYAYNGETVENGIRFGTGNSAGSITFTINTECDIVFKWYYSYNGSTGEVVSYDAGSKVIVDDVDHAFDDENTPLTVHLSAGTHTISSYHYVDPETSEKTTGRIILSSFEFEGEPYSIYTKNALARVSEVQAVNTRVANHETTTHNRFVTDEQAIEANRQNIVNINNTLGDIQFFDIYNHLPTPRQEFLKKVFRYDNKFYQCIKSGEGVQKEWTFANVSGTSEITSNNVSSFYSDAGNQFNTYFEVDYGTTTKFYRNAGSLKLGSSSATGIVEFRATSDAQNLPITSLKFGVKAYNTNGSTVWYEAEFINEDETDSQYASGTIFLSDNTTETLFDLSSNIPSGYKLSYLDISSVAQHNTGTEEEPVMVNNDKRLIITKLTADFGEITYKWQAVGGDAAPIFNYDQMTDWNDDFNPYKDTIDEFTLSNYVRTVGLTNMYPWEPTEVKYTTITMEQAIALFDENISQIKVHAQKLDNEAIFGNTDYILNRFVTSGPGTGCLPIFYSGDLIAFVYVDTESSEEDPTIMLIVFNYYQSIESAALLDYFTLNLSEMTAQTATPESLEQDAPIKAFYTNQTNIRYSGRYWTQTFTDVEAQKIQLKIYKGESIQLNIFSISQTLNQPVISCASKVLGLIPGWVGDGFIITLGLADNSITFKVYETVPILDIPALPTTAGTYNLQIVIDSQGTATSSWVIDNNVKAS